MSYEDRKKAYEKDLQQYGYVKQSTINRFASQVECKEPITKRSGNGVNYLKKIHADIKERWFITNETVNAITWFIPPKPQKRKVRKKKKLVKTSVGQTKRRYYKDSHVYHKIFEDYYWSIKYCMICWSTDKLQIHHKDKNHKNNDISNLIMLCYKCHCLAHEWDRVYKLMIKQGK